MNTEGYAVQWRNRTYHLSDLTDGVKFDYCTWLYGHMLGNARRRMPADAYLRYEDKLTAAPPEWTSLPDMAVLASLDRVDGQRQLTRLLFGVTPMEMSDSDLDAMEAEKKQDANSDMNVAMKLIREHADPKVPRAGSGSPARADANAPTPPSATSPSASPEQKSAA